MPLLSSFLQTVSLLNFQLHVKTMQLYHAISVKARRQRRMIKPTTEKI